MKLKVLVVALSLAGLLGGAAPVALGATSAALECRCAPDSSSIVVADAGMTHDSVNMTYNIAPGMTHD